MVKAKTTRTKAKTTRRTARPGLRGRPGRLGRPSRIHDTIREGRCEECGDWFIVGASFRRHFEAGHPGVEPPTAGRLRDIPVVERIVEYVAAGVALDAAAGVLGIGARTVYAWQSIGQEWEEAEEAEIPADRRPYVAFAAAVRDARISAQQRHLRAIERASTTDWKAAAWLLERQWPDRYGRVDRLRVGGDADAGPVRVIHVESDPDFIGEVMKIYRQSGVVPDVEDEPGE